jgi:hypothetical protein
MLLGLALAGGLAWVFVLCWRRALRNDAGPLPFFRMARAEGVDLPAQGDAETLRVAQAVRRCALCSGQDECRQAFDAGRPQDVQAGCPNAELFHRLRLR